MPKAIRPFAAFTVTLTGILVLFYLPWLSGLKDFYLSDMTYYFQPLTNYFRQSVSQGRLPLWNPYFYCGMSQLAIPNPCIFYPFTWLFAYLPFSQAQAVWMVVHQVIAGAGGYLFVSGLGWGACAAATAGFVLALTGYMFSLTANSTLVASACWLPVCLFAVRRLRSGFDDGNLMSLVYLAVCVFMLLTSGRPEVSVPALLLLALYIAVAAAGGARRPAAAGKALFRCLALLAGGLMAMPMILPALEWIPLSPRSHGLSAAEVFRWSANWYDCLCLFLPQPLGDLNLFGTRYLNLVATRPNFIPYIASAYVGPVVLTLCLWGLFDTRLKWRFFLLAVLSAGLIFSLGGNLPVFPYLIERLPALAVFRYPVKLMIVPVWCLAVFAARGMYLVVRRGPSAWSIRLSMAFWLAAAAVSLALASGLCGLPLKAVAPPAVGLDIVRGAQGLIALSGLRAAIIGILVVFVVALVKRRVLRSTNAFVLILASLVGSLVAAAWVTARHGAPAGYFDRPSYLASVVKQLGSRASGTSTQAHRVLPLYFDPLNCPAWYRGRLPQPGTLNSHSYAREMLLPATNMDFSLCSSFGYESSETADYRKLFLSVLKKSGAGASARPGIPLTDSAKASDLPLAGFCQITATAYVFTQVLRSGSPPQAVPALDPSLFDLLVDDPRMNARVYGVKKPNPRAYLAASWKECPTAEAIAAIGDPQRSGFTAGGTAFVEPGAALSSPGLPELVEQTGTVEGECVELMVETPEHISFSARTARQALFVFANHFYPGWKVRVDGVEQSLRRVNAVLMGVFLPAGSHLVEFDFKPDCLEYASTAAAAGAGLLALLLAFVGGRKFWAMAKRQARGW